jgi:uncharacterized RDD family membrane protein YckC
MAERKVPGAAETRLLDASRADARRQDTRPLDTRPLDTDEQLITGEAVTLDLRATPFVLRAAGTIIDMLVSIAIFLLVILLLSSPIGDGLDEATMATLSIASLVFCIVIVPTAVETATHGRSLGKLAIGARIVRDDGGAIGFRHAFIRALTGAVELYSTLGGAAAITALLHPKAKRLGDLLAGTYSQHERMSRLIPPQTVLPPALATWASIADVARMPDGLARRIARFLAPGATLSPQARTAFGAQLAAEAARYVSPVPDAPAEDFLTAVSVLRRDREYRALMLQRERLDRLAPTLEGLPRAFPERG